MDTRQRLRVPLRCPVRFSSLHNPQLSGEGMALDFSLSGWMVESRQPVQLDTDLRLQIELSDESEPLEIPLANVEWASGRRFGIRTIEMTDKAWQSLYRLWLERKTALV